MFPRLRQGIAYSAHPPLALELRSDTCSLHPPTYGEGLLGGEVGRSWRRRNVDCGRRTMGGWGKVCLVGIVTV